MNKTTFLPTTISFSTYARNSSRTSPKNTPKFDPHKTSQFLSACKNGNIEKINELFKDNQVNINSKVETEETPIYIKSFYKTLKLVKYKIYQILLKHFWNKFYESIFKYELLAT